MQSNYARLFSLLEKPEPPKDLFAKIAWRIQKAERMLVLRKTIFFAVLFVCSAGALVPAFYTLRINAARSGFMEFFSLMFSDFDSVIVHWQSFVLAVLESLPALSIAFVFGAIFVLFSSLKLLARHIKPLIPNH